MKYLPFLNSLLFSDKFNTAYRKLRRILGKPKTEEPREDFNFEDFREKHITDDLRFCEGGNSGTKVTLI